MDKAPDGSVIQGSSSDEEANPPMGGAGKDTGKCSDRNPTGSAGACP